MSVDVKICGLSTPETMTQAVLSGADYVGLNFYEPSPRFVTPEQAGALVRDLPANVRKVAVTVDASDELLGAIAATLNPDFIQLHGREDPTRVAQVRDTFGRPVIKAIMLRDPSDLDQIPPFDAVADMFLFDAKAPDSLENALPGGNGVAFDWSLIAELETRTPHMLSGGLTVENVALAIEQTGVGAVDVSSGVESAPGIKDVEKIRRFLIAAKTV